MENATGCHFLVHPGQDLGKTDTFLSAECLRNRPPGRCSLSCRLPHEASGAAGDRAGE
jgi:hypothetical protein